MQIWCLVVHMNMMSTYTFVSNLHLCLLCRPTLSSTSYSSYPFRECVCLSQLCCAFTIWSNEQGRDDLAHTKRGCLQRSANRKASLGK